MCCARHSREGLLGAAAIATADDTGNVAADVASLSSTGAGSCTTFSAVVDSSTTGRTKFSATVLSSSTGGIAFSATARCSTDGCNKFSPPLPLLSLPTVATYAAVDASICGTDGDPDSTFGAASVADSNTDTAADTQGIGIITPRRSLIPLSACLRQCVYCLSNP